MVEPYTSPAWSGLAIDLLIHIVHLLELPEALAFRAVCPLWRSASTAAAGGPCTRQTPWLVSLVTDSPRGSVSSKFRNLLDQKTYQVSFPRGKAVALCGASHGWLVVANELPDLVLYDPFAMTTILLPPITGFSKCIEGVYGDDGNIEGYRYLFYRAGDATHDVVSPGMNFYDKVVLSGSPSAGSGAIALVVHTHGKHFSFARVGGISSWRLLVSMTERNDEDIFADVVHHRGSRFYTLTMRGILVSFNFRRRNPDRELIIGKDDKNAIMRYLVSTPWGHLLQIRVIFDTNQKNGFTVEIDRVDLKSRRLVGLTPTEALQRHTLFLGQNSPSVLSTDKFLELRPDCIYFTTPRLMNETAYGNRYNRWSGVKVYDLKKQTLEAAFPWRGENCGRASNPLEVWFTPSQFPYKTFSASLPSLYDSH
ncbi:hypothetical protein ACQ4PT_068023 [Festuca glaucescens]